LKKNFSERNLDLNSFEIKLCAYFRLGLNTKEISAIEEMDLNEIIRCKTAIRRKLNLNDSESLKDYYVYPQSYQ
jgi:hypothetical protein